MEIRYASKDRFTQIRLSGELDHHAARDTMIKLDRLLDTCLPLKLELDFSGVGFMDSSGIAVIMRVCKRMRELGGSVTVTEVPAQAKRVLYAANMQRLVQIM